MGSAIIFTSVFLFLVYIISLFYAGFSYMQYRDLIPRPQAVGLLTGIRAALRSMHDPHDPNVTDECRAYLKHCEIGITIAIVAMFLMGILITVVRTLGL